MRKIVVDFTNLTETQPLIWESFCPKVCLPWTIFFWESFFPKRLTQKKGEMMTPNPLSQQLAQFMQEYKLKQEEMAAKLGISRRSLYSAINPDKDVDSFKLGFLRKMSAIFPMTIIISRGKIRIFRWDTIIQDGFESDK